MKTFSRLTILFVFLGIVLMLVGNTAEAQDPSLEVAGISNYQVGAPVKVTFRAAEAGADYKEDIPLYIEASGDVSVDSHVVPGTYNTETSGYLTVTGTITGTGPNTYISARWNSKDLFAKADLSGDPLPPPKTIIKVLAPEPCDHADTYDPAKGVKVGDVFKQRVYIKDANDLASWQMNVVFNPHILEVVSVEEGNFLEKPITIPKGHGPHANPDVETHIPVDAIFLSSVGAGWIPVTDWKVGKDDLEIDKIDPGPKHVLDHPASDIADYLKRDNESGLFKTAVAEGKVVAMQARIGPRTHMTSPIPDTAVEAPHKPLNGVTGSGDLMSICFRVLEVAEEPLGIHNVQLSNSEGNRISYSIQVNSFIVVTRMFPKEDVNRDGYVNIQDLVLVASNIGLVPGNLHNPKADTNGDGVYGEGDGVRSGMYTESGNSVGDSHARVDVNNDGIVNVLDLITVAMSENWGGESKIVDIKGRTANVASLTAPSNLTPRMIQGWIDLAQVEDDGSAIFDLGIANLEALIASRIPTETRLLLNYPNPFNPETWIPYQLAEATEVTVMIHTMNGSLVRTIELGHQAAGTYKSKSQAAYWDGRNEFGEQVASGLYFYTLTAGDFSATHKMLVRK